MTSNSIHLIRLAKTTKQKYHQNIIDNKNMQSLENIDVLENVENPNLEKPWIILLLGGVSFAMAIINRALFAWFTYLSFLILLVLRLDKWTKWSWFIVFIPMWLHDGILLLYSISQLIFRSQPNNRNMTSTRWKIWNLVRVILKLTAQILLCLKLDYFDLYSPTILPLYYVMIPVWIVLAVTLCDVAFNCNPFDYRG